jgi:hypothetical protein
MSFDIEPGLFFLAQYRQSLANNQSQFQLQAKPMSSLLQELIGASKTSGPIDVEAITQIFAEMWRAPATKSVSINMNDRVQGTQGLQDHRYRQASNKSKKALEIVRSELEAALEKVKACQDLERAGSVGRNSKRKAADDLEWQMGKVGGLKKRLRRALGGDRDRFELDLEGLAEDEVEDVTIKGENTDHTVAHAVEDNAGAINFH